MPQITAKEPLLCRLLFIKRNIPITTRQKKEYLKAFKIMLKNGGQPEIGAVTLQKHFFDFMSSNMSIIDGKASGILQFNGILLAAVGAFLTASNDPGKSIEAILLYNATFTALLSVILSHRVIWVRWPGSAQLLNRDDKQERVLLSIRDSRTMFYRRAWCFSMISIAFFMIFLLYKSYEHLLSKNASLIAASSFGRFLEPISEKLENCLTVKGHEILYAFLFFMLFLYDLILSFLIRLLRLSGS